MAVLSDIADECHHGKAGEILPEILGLSADETTDGRRQEAVGRRQGDASKCVFLLPASCILVLVTLNPRPLTPNHCP